MSKVWKGIKKAFKAVLKIVKIIAIVVIIAAAIYFTAGYAATYFGTLAGGATTGFAAGAQAFFAAVQTTIGTWGTAMWQAGVSAFGGGGAGLGAAETAAVFAPAGTGTVLAPTAASAGAGLGTTAVAAGTGTVLAPVVGPAAQTGLLANVGTALKNTSFTDKLLLAKTGTDLVGGFTAPTVQEKAEAEKTFVGSFYGRNADGSGGGVVDIGSGGAQPVFTPERPAPAPSAQALFDQRTNLATNPEGKVFDPRAAATRPNDLFQRDAA